MYTPAVPELPAQFNAAASVVNLTISGFYLFFPIGMLLFGPVCDRVGRKPVLVGGLVAFSAGSVACAAIWSIEALILFRLIEATGAGAVCAVSTAIIKDRFKPERRTALFWFCR
ncbi:MFS transporter [Senegalimassilia anaerobia]|jgi:MFS transporter, DHA1 family, multidrug resistance protein|nr:MFS transporter [uncultured Senegalimassilia sp.]MBL6464374.1 MFS transporter [Senegalimassilia sp.]